MRKDVELVAQSFTLSVKEVKSLTDKGVIERAQIKIIERNNKEVSLSETPYSQGYNVEVLHTLQEKAGKYKVTFLLKDSNQEILDTVTVEVTVTSKKKLIVFVLTILALLALALGFWWYSQNRHPTVSSGLPKVGTEKMTDAQLKQYADKKVDGSNVTLQVYPKVNVENDGRTAYLWVQNVPVNTTGQTVTLKNKTTGDVLYTSDLLEPGYQTSQVSLDKKLSKGTHSGLVTLTFYDLKEQKQVGQTDVEVTITVR